MSLPTDPLALAACPFCGGPARKPIMYNGTLETGCGGDFECAGTDVLAPIAAWNTRAAPVPSAPVVSEEVVRDILDAIWKEAGAGEPWPGRIAAFCAEPIRAALAALPNHPPREDKKEEG